MTVPGKQRADSALLPKRFHCPKPSVQEWPFGKASSRSFKPHFSSVPFVLAQELIALGWVVAIDSCELWIVLLVNGDPDAGQNGPWDDNGRYEHWCHFWIINPSVFCCLLSEKASECVSIDDGVRMNQLNFPYYSSTLKTHRQILDYLTRFMQLILGWTLTEPYSSFARVRVEQEHEKMSRYTFMSFQCQLFWT